VALLLINGVLLQRTESRLRRATEGDATVPDQWKRMRTFSMLSIALWIATFLAGSILTNAT
jgi:hypothetical protein